MAKYENLGYCPANAVFRKAVEVGDEKILDELGPLLQFMVYPEGSTASDGARIVPMLFSKVGVLAAQILWTFAPDCEYPDEGKMIELHDVVVFDPEAYDYDILMDGFRVGFRNEYEKIVMEIAAS